MKNTHNDSSSQAFQNTDFYQLQKEQAYANKHLIDLKRKKERIEKNVWENNYFLRKNIAYRKALNVSIEFISIAQNLMQRKDFTILSPLINQCVRSATSVAANLAESAAPVISPKDKINKMSISFKECIETMHWLNVFYEMEELTVEQYNHLFDECTQIAKILAKTISTIKKQK